jgi:hypothetical protein
MPIRATICHTFKQSRWYRRLLWAGAGFLLYALVGFFLLPPIIKSQLARPNISIYAAGDE